MSAPVQILMSKRAAGHFGAGVATAMGERPYRIVLLEDVPADGSPCAIDVALLSRDVTGRSGKFKITEALAHFLDVLARSPNLAWVQTHSAGTDRPTWKPIKARGIRLTTSSGMATTVALSAVGGIIALARRFPDLADAQRRHAWEPLLEERAPRDLAGQTAVIAGLGPIGTEVARLLKAVGLRVVGIRRAAQPHLHCDETAAYGDLAKYLPKTDWLVLACPLTELTRGLVDAAAIASLPKGACIVNVARGEVISEQAMIEALRDGHLGGAWLDVFEYEPLDPASPLWDLPRVMISPHSSGAADGNYARAGAVFLDNLARWREGRPLANEASRLEAS
ncbi:D-2-hydroxyacid dehydrogenase [Usitatibacter palustris]|uniref:Glyoxylate/hydroxypyruvate reductase A n=1 Tax=Usitatibacter palustris TaxID=2732487 RepID=A0A6M4H2F0_9PROT|nr:D-2-hydroxyacid dehydrogenase [Usitatibacter palustris]QJR13721.1 Glyoxylate/hydroxypyruvate reductase A [Usitatibacter palustris]